MTHKQKELLDFLEVWHAVFALSGDRQDFHYCSSDQYEWYPEFEKQYHSIVSEGEIISIPAPPGKPLLRFSRRGRSEDPLVSISGYIHGWMSMSETNTMAVVFSKHVPPLLDYYEHS